MSKKINNSVYGANIRRNVNDQFKCVRENWIRESFDDGVKEWWPMENGNLKVLLGVDNGVDDQDIAKSNNQMPRHLSSDFLGQSKRLMINVFREIDGFYGVNI